MVEYFKLYEDWQGLSLKKKNIYSLLGQNIVNYLNDLSKKIKKSSNITNKLIGDIDHESKVKNLSISQVLKLIHNLSAESQANVKNSKEVGFLKNVFVTHYQTLTYIILSFKFDTRKLSKVIKEEWFNPLIIEKPEDLKTQIDKINLIWNKNSTDDLKQNQERLSNLLKNELSVFDKVFQNEKMLHYRDLTNYQIKPDEQQTEAENKINDLTNKLDSEQLSKFNPESEVKKVAALPELKGVNLTEDFLKHFDQPGLPGSHKMMKKFFLERFAEAEKEFGSKLVITSGIRTEEYQRYLTSLGYQTAKKNSPHIAGVAADISIINLDVNKLIAAFEKLGFTRFGIGKSFLHVDLGDQLNPKIWVPYARWTYNY